MSQYTGYPLGKLLSSCSIPGNFFAWSKIKKIKVTAPVLLEERQYVDGSKVISLESMLNC